VTENPVDALQAMAKRTALAMVARELEVLANGGAVTITLHPQDPPPRRALPPKPTKRKPGPKPSAGRGWSPERRAKFMATIAAQGKTARGPAPVEKREPGRPKKVVVPDEARCVACDHTKGEHDPQTGKCLSWRCVCTLFAW
jgi:hypothetical protein